MTSPRALPRALGVALMAIVGASSLPTSPHPVAAWTSAIDGVTHGTDGGSAGTDIGRATTVGPDGSIYVAGFFESSAISLNDEPVLSLIGNSAAFIAKLDADGEPVWFTRVGATGSNVSIDDIELTPDGGLVVAGEFKTATTPIMIGADSITSAGTEDGFVAKYDGNGDGVWATRLGGTDDDGINDVVVEPDGSLVAVGTIISPVTFDSQPQTSAPWGDTGVSDGVVVYLDADGTPTGMTWIGGIGLDRANRVAVTPSGTVLVAGSVDTTNLVEIRTSTTVHRTSGAFGSRDMLVASLEPNGTVNWSQISGGTGEDNARGIVVDSMGHATANGDGTPPFVVGGVSHPGGGTGRKDIVLTQFAVDGTPRWTRVVDGGSTTTNDESRHLALGPEDRLITSGRLGSTSPSTTHFASMVHDRDGNLIRGPYLLGNPANQIAQGAAVTQAGDLLLTGRFAGGPVDPTDPNPTLTVGGESDIVVIRIAGALQSSQTITFTAPADRPFVPTPFALSPTTDATGLSVTLTSTTTDVCTVNGLEVTTVDTGTCTLTASQAGERHYTRASPITHSFTVTPAVQTITFPTPADRDLTSTPFTLAPTTDASGLAVSLSSDTADTCTVDGLDVTIIAPGTCTITASQPGDSRYAAATPVTRSFTITAPETTTSAPTTTTPTTTTPTTTTSEPVAILPSTGFAPDGSTLPLLLGAFGALVALVSRRRA